MSAPTRHPVVRLPLLIIIVQLLLVSGPFQTAATAQLAGSTWVVSGTAAVKLTGGDGIPDIKQKINGTGLAQFLPGGVFSFEDVTATSIGGSWSMVGDELQVTVTPEDIDTFLDDNLGFVLQGLEIDKLSSKAKLKQKQSGVGNLAYKLSFVLSFTVDGVPVRVAYKLAVKGRYDLTGGPSEGGTWALGGKQTFKAPGAKLTSDSGLQLILGPDGGLLSDRFVLRDGTGDLFGGYYTRVMRKVYLLPDSSSMDGYVETWIAPTVEQMFPGGTVDLDVSFSKFVGTLKKNGTFKLRGKSKFFSDLDRGEQLGFFKSSFRINAKS